MTYDIREARYQIMSHGDWFPESSGLNGVELFDGRLVVEHEDSVLFRSVGRWRVVQESERAK